MSRLSIALRWLSHSKSTGKIVFIYIYKVNDRRGKPDKPFFVFKTSSTKAKISLSMNRDEDHFVKSYYCFFKYGKPKICRDFATLTASVLSSVLKTIPAGNHGSKE